MENTNTTQPEPKRFGAGFDPRSLRRTAAGIFVGASLLAACGSTATEVASDLEETVVAEVVEETTTTEAEAPAEDAAVEADVEEVEVVAEAEEGAPPEGAPPEGGEGAPPEDGERPPRGGDETAAEGDDTNLLTDGPQNVGEHGPFSNADSNGDGTVTREELDGFMDGALEREIGLVAFFDIYDTDADEVLTIEEQSTVTPAYAFDGTDSNEDGLVSLEEVTVYANEEGRSYRAIGLGNFFDLVDTDGNAEVSPEEIEVAHVSGLLARY